MVSILERCRFQRPLVNQVVARLHEPRRFIQVVGGPRQVGKTTMVLQALALLATPSLYVAADEPTLRDRGWLTSKWNEARLLAQTSPGAVLVIDEIQKVSDWSETVKYLWDSDTREDRDLRVLLLGSSPLLMQKGLTESLAGRFELTRVTHWSLAEMRHAFGFDLERFLVFGGYPGAAQLVDDPQRWRRYILDAHIETTLSRDILQMTRIEKPALLRRLFELGCLYSAQELSFTKMLGQLQEAGNTVTLAHYLELLEGAGLLMGLQKFAGDQARRRSSSPKLQVLNTALMTATGDHLPGEWSVDPEARGRLAESAVGGHLAAACKVQGWHLHYWRNGKHEVDFVVVAGRKVTAFEVKSGIRSGVLSGMQKFGDMFQPDRTLLVGGDGISLEQFLEKPAETWIAH